MWFNMVNLDIFVQLIINSLIAGSIYALVASGFSLIYSANKYLHLAHGVSVALGGYLVFWLFNQLGINFYLSSLITIIIMGFLGVGMYRLFYLPLQNKKSSNVILLIASLGILILFQNILQILFGANVEEIGFLEVRKGINFLGASITPLQIFIIIVSFVLFISLYLFMKYTKLGRNMRAVSDNKELASVIGINHHRISDYSFFIGSSLAGVAGILIGLEQNLEPSMGTMLIVKGFTGAVIGGMNSVAGSVAGSVLLGFAENFGVWYRQYLFLDKDAIAFVLLFLFLLFKPNGIFGVNKGTKK